MTIETTKLNSDRDAAQVLQGIYNNNGTISTDGFASSKVGAKITRTAVSSTIEDYRYLDVLHSEIVGTTNASAVLQFADEPFQLLRIGQYVFGTGIPANTTIISFDLQAKTATMSANATATGTPTIKFANLLQRLRVEYDNSSHDNVDDVERLD